MKAESPLYAPYDDTPRPLVASRTKGISNERIKDDGVGARLGFKRVLLAGTNLRPDGAARTEHPLITKAEGIILASISGDLAGQRAGRGEFQGKPPKRV